MSTQIKLSQTDLRAFDLGDANYINNKGAGFYNEQDFVKAVEYYRLAATMGNVQAVSNLGYCYLYGRSIEANTELAIAYFRLAAEKQNVDAAYKLGDIYGSEKWGYKDRELAVYYYRMAASWLIGKEWEEYGAIVWEDKLSRYPSLCYALGRELSPGGTMTTNIELSYAFLKHAERGYEIELQNGSGFYAKSLEGVKALLVNPQYDLVREEYDNMFAEEYDDEQSTDDE